jgi:hypothetical protein
MSEQVKVVRTLTYTGSREVVTKVLNLRYVQGRLQVSNLYTIDETIDCDDEPTLKVIVGMVGGAI